MRKSTTKNYIYNLMYQILILILPLITTPYISRVLGAENIGIFSYTTSITAFFILFGSLGTALYGQREIAFVQNDKSKYTKVFWEVFSLRSITTVITLILYYVFFGIKSEYSIYYRILTLEVLGNCIDISWFFQGLEEFKKTVIRNTIIKILSIICIFSFVKTREDLIIYFMVYVLALFLGNLSLWMYLPKFLSKIKIRELNIIKHLKPTVYLFIPQIAVQVYTILDKTMIGSIITDKSEVGYYDQSQKIIKILLTVEGAFGTVMMPRMANIFSQKNFKLIKENLYKSFSMAYILAFPMIFGVILLADDFVPIYFGEGFERVALLMKVTSPIILFIGISGCIGHQYLLPTKRQKEYTVSVILGALINLIVNSLLIWKYQAVGAAIGTIVAEFSVAVCQLLMIRKTFKVKKFLRLSRNYLLSSVAMFIVCYFIKFFVKAVYLKMGLIIVSAVVIYVLMLLILRDKFLNEMINKFFKKSK